MEAVVDQRAVLLSQKIVFIYVVLITSVTRADELFYINNDCSLNLFCYL